MRVPFMLYIHTYIGTEIICMSICVREKKPKSPALLPRFQPTPATHNARASSSTRLWLPSTPPATLHPPPPPPPSPPTPPSAKKPIYSQDISLPPTQAPTREPNPRPRVKTRPSHSKSHPPLPSHPSPHPRGRIYSTSKQPVCLSAFPPLSTSDVP